MKEENFKQLLESIKEVGLMEQGKLAPIREFTGKNRQSGSNFEAFAICLTTEEEELIPMKIYRIIFHPHLKTCTLKDENNETLACPDEWFLPIEFPKNIQQVLEQKELALT